MNALYLAEAARDWLQWGGMAQRVEVCGVVFAPIEALQSLQARPDSIEAQRDYFAHGLAALRAWAGPLGGHHADLAAHIIGLPQKRELVIVDGRLHIVDGVAQQREHTWTQAQEAAVEALAGAIQGQARRYLAGIEATLEADPSLELEPVRERDGILWADAVLADTLAAVASDVVDTVQAAARDRWSSADARLRLLQWADVTDRALTPGVEMLAALHWQRDLEQHTKRVWGNPAGLTLATMRTLDRSLLNPYALSHKRKPEMQVELHLDGVVVANTPTLADGAIMDAIAEGVLKISGPTGLRLLTHIVRETQRRQVEQRLPSSMAVDLTYSSWHALATAIGESEGRAETQLRDILQALQHMRVTWPDGEVGGLLLYQYQNTSKANGKPGRGACITITPARVLRTGYAHDHKRHEDRVIMPLPDTWPYLGTVRQERAQAMRFALKAWSAIVERRLTWHPAGGAALTEADVWSLAKSAGFTKQERAFALWQAWQQDTPEHPAFIEAVAPGVYHLANNPQHQRQREYVDKTVRLSARRAKAGAESAKSARARKDRKRTKT